MSFSSIAFRAAWRCMLNAGLLLHGPIPYHRLSTLPCVEHCLNAGHMYVVFAKIVLPAHCLRFDFSSRFRGRCVRWWTCDPSTARVARVVLRFADNLRRSYMRLEDCCRIHALFRCRALLAVERFAMLSESGKWDNFKQTYCKSDSMSSS